MQCNSNSSLQSLNVARTHRKVSGLDQTTDRTFESLEKVDLAAKQRNSRPRNGLSGREKDPAAEAYNLLSERRAAGSEYRHRAAELIGLEPLSLMIVDWGGVEPVGIITA
ncbi:hypothetical protein RHMOL_Rhmol08G0155900 [Rhododendron molle]|uniref:Uncharacterized protein n=1 Tax=Rhododendron molle TaxID=49168 RepID=A0ACC0MP07_RHOML|nr:hypothetical protein RHMOL_Rhmol08G0155900 [Rhododendron molle]